MPKVEHAMRAAEEPRPEDGVGAAVDDRLEEHRPVPWVVLEVGVLYDDDIPGARREGGADRRALPAILGMQLQDIDASRGLELREPLTGAVRREVVNADDLLAHRHRVDLVEDAVDRLPLVVDRDQDREDEVADREWGAAAHARAGHQLDGGRGLVHFTW